MCRPLWTPSSRWPVAAATAEPTRGSRAYSSSAPGPFLPHPVRQPPSDARILALGEVTCIKTLMNRETSAMLVSGRHCNLLAPAGHGVLGRRVTPASVDVGEGLDGCCHCGCDVSSHVSGSCADPLLDGRGVVSPGHRPCILVAVSAGEPADVGVHVRLAERRRAWVVGQRP